MQSAFGIEHGEVSKSMTLTLLADTAKAGVKAAKKGKKLRAMETESLARQLKASGKSNRVDSPARPGVFSSTGRKRAWERGWAS